MANIRELSPELTKAAQEDLGENPDRLQDDLYALRSWMDKQPHLIARTDDQFLVTFLRCCKFSLEESKKRIEAFFTCKTMYPDLFKIRSVDATTLEIIRRGYHIVPPKPVPNSGQKLFLSQLAHFDPKVHSLRDIFKVQFMLFEMLAFEDDNASINSLEQVFDLKNCNLNQALYFEPAVLKKIYIFLYQCIPLHVNKVHIINLAKELQTFFKFTRTMLPSELPFELFVHEEVNDLFNYIPREAMIVEYGGKNGTKLEILEDWEKRLQDHAEYFEKDSHYGTNEKLRRGPIVSLQTEFGVDGSFRKLEID